MPMTVEADVLVVADDAEIVRLVTEALSERGLRACVRGAAQAGPELAERPWDLIVADLAADSDVLAFVRRARRHRPETPAIVLRGQGVCGEGLLRLPTHVEVLDRPPAASSLRELLQTLLPNHPVPLAAVAADEGGHVCPIAGTSRKFLQTIELALRVAPTSLPVLVAGESGVGKELVSHLIHCRSSRSHGPYVRVNCAALSESLLESELFGHEKGAFTGACARRRGRFERAHGGTLLLDEISETGPRLQAELLRVLEQQDFERLGGEEIVCVNVRILSTSNVDLAGQVRRGRFRKDLYYRVSAVQLTVPPLRERVEDIPVLVWHFVNQHGREARRRIVELDEDMLRVFREHPWPGNVRQLRNVVCAALLFGQGPVLSLKDVPPLREEMEAGRTAEPATLHLPELERRAILEALRRTRRNQVKAARLLGITDRTLREKLRRYRQAGEVQAAGEERW